MSTSRICERDFGRDAQRVYSKGGLLAETKLGVSLAASISQAFVNCLPFGCFDSVAVSLHAGGWMVEKTRIRNEVAILVSRG